MRSKANKNLDGKVQNSKAREKEFINKMIKDSDRRRVQQDKIDFIKDIAD